MNGKLLTYRERLLAGRGPAQRLAPPVAPSLLPDAVKERTAAGQGAWRLVLQIAAVVPSLWLTRSERSEKGALMFPAGPAFVERLVKDLRGDPVLYADLQGRAARLAARQAEAHVWRRLRFVLAYLYEVVSDLHLSAQGDCNREAMDIAAELEAGCAAAGSEGRGLARLLGIDAALSLLEHYRALRRRGPARADKAQAGSKARRRDHLSRMYTWFARFSSSWQGPRG